MSHHRTGAVSHRLGGRYATLGDSTRPTQLAASAGLHDGLPGDRERTGRVDSRGVDASGSAPYAATEGDVALLTACSSMAMPTLSPTTTLPASSTESHTRL